MMIILPNNKKCSLWFKRTVVFIIVAFSSGLVIPPGYAQVMQPIAGTILNLPIPGAMIKPSHKFVPPLLRGIKVHPENPFRFEFFIEQGDEDISKNILKEESKKLIRYFLASLAVPEHELWVNLSPYEKDRIIPKDFGVTEMGRDLLSQDYLLKQLTASLIYPEEELGKKFWDRVYEKAHQLYGTNEIPMNTFNKVWIIPDTARVFEEGEMVIVLESHLKVMLEEDYVAMDFHQKSTATPRFPDRGLALEHHNQKADVGAGFKPAPTVVSSVSSEIIREIILPETERSKKPSGDSSVPGSVTQQIIKEIIVPAIEKEINQGENFAQLRQIYHSMILAAWYKQALKKSLLGQIYVDQNKVKGIALKDKTFKDQIYKQYLEAYKKGVFDYIKEDYDSVAREMIPRKYFSGGFFGSVQVELAQPEDFRPGDSAVVSTFWSKIRASRVLRTVMELFETQALGLGLGDEAIARSSPVRTYLLVAILAGLFGAVDPVDGQVPLDGDPGQAGTWVQDPGGLSLDALSYRFAQGDLSTINEAVECLISCMGSDVGMAYDFLVFAANADGTSSVRHGLIDVLANPEVQNHDRAILLLRDIGLGGVSLELHEFDTLLASARRDYRLVSVFKTLDPATVPESFIEGLRDLFFEQSQPQRSYRLRQSLASVFGGLAPEVAMNMMGRLYNRGRGWMFYLPYFLAGSEGQIGEEEFSGLMGQTQERLGSVSFGNLQKMASRHGSLREGAMVDVLWRILDVEENSGNEFKELVLKPEGSILLEAHIGTLAQMLEGRYTSNEEELYLLRANIIDLLSYYVNDNTLMPRLIAQLMPALVGILGEEVSEFNGLVVFEKLELKYMVIDLLEQHGLLETFVGHYLEEAAVFLKASIDYELLNIKREQEGLGRKDPFYVGERSRLVLKAMLQLNSDEAFAKADEVIRLYPHRVGAREGKQYPDNFDPGTVDPQYSAVLAMYDFLNPAPAETQLPSIAEEAVEKTEESDEMPQEDVGEPTKVYRPQDRNDFEIHITQRSGEEAGTTVVEYFLVMPGKEPSLYRQELLRDGKVSTEVINQDIYISAEVIGRNYMTRGQWTQEEVDSTNSANSFINDATESFLSEREVKIKADRAPKLMRLALFHEASVNGLTWGEIEERFLQDEAVYLDQLVAIENQTFHLLPYRAFVLEQWGKSLDRLTESLPDEALTELSFEIRFVFSNIFSRFGEEYLESQSKVFDYLRTFARSGGEVSNFIMEHKTLLLRDAKNGYENFAEHFPWIISRFLGWDISADELDFLEKLISYDSEAAARVWALSTRLRPSSMSKEMKEKYRLLSAMVELAGREGNSEEDLKLKARMAGKYLWAVAAEFNPMSWDEVERRILEEDGIEIDQERRGYPEIRINDVDGQRGASQGTENDPAQNTQDANNSLTGIAQDSDFVQELRGLLSEDEAGQLSGLADAINGFPLEEALAVEFLLEEANKGLPEFLSEAFPEIFPYDSTVPLDEGVIREFLEFAKSLLGAHDHPEAFKRLNDFISIQWGNRSDSNTSASSPLKTTDPSAVGGIDMSLRHLEFQIKRNQQGIPLPMKFQNMEKIKGVDLAPVFIQFTPATFQHLPILLGLIDEESDTPKNADYTPKLDPVDRKRKIMQKSPA